MLHMALRVIIAGHRFSTCIPRPVWRFPSLNSRSIRDPFLLTQSSAGSEPLTKSNWPKHSLNHGRHPKKSKGYSGLRVVMETPSQTKRTDPGTMRAMVLETPKTLLKSMKMDIPEPSEGHIRVRVLACAVCRTDLHVVDGDLKHPKLPIIPGHEIVGVVDKVGAGIDQTLFSIGKRVGIPWLGRTCGKCVYCLDGAENLCDDPGFTGYQIDGGYAEYAVAHASYCFFLPEVYSDIEVAPLLCAGLIGYRSLRKTGFKPGLGKKKRIGIYGFGAAAHIVAQVAIHEGHQIYAFTRAGDKEAQAFALRLGAIWAGDSTSLPPCELDAAILFAPVGLLVPAALKAVRKGGIVVAGGIHMSDIPAFPYSILWGERQVVSVANLTRQDAIEFLELAPKAFVKTQTVVFPLEEANEALASLREGRLEGAAVLVP